MTGISRKLPDTERTRLKAILKKVTPENGGVIVRTAAEGAAEAELDRDITRLAAQWESIEKKAKTASAPALLYGEPDLTIRVIRDVFNEDFSKLIVSGEDGWEVIDEYVRYVAPHLADRISRWDSADNAPCPLERARTTTSSPPTGSTSSSPRRSSARCGCRAAARWSSTAPRP